MADTQCCPTMDLQWTQRVIDGQYADVNFCASCGHVHLSEQYVICLRFPSQDRCVNCGGDLALTQPGLARPTPSQILCTACGLTAADDKALHDHLASLHPDRDFLAASRALVEHGRYVLALKLATAETRWGRDPVEGEVQRLGVLEAMNETERALDEAYEWSNAQGCPQLIFGVVAQLEASAGNVRGAIAALEKGLSISPDHADWWADFAELQLHQDDRPAALRAASKAMLDPAQIKRGLSVIVEAGERLYASGQYAEALGACSLAGDHQEKNADLAWLRARIAAVNQDTSYMLKWLETTVQLDPNHEPAKQMLAPYQKKKKSWFSW